MSGNVDLVNHDFALLNGRKEFASWKRWMKACYFFISFLFYTFKYLYVGHVFFFSVRFTSMIGPSALE